MTRPVAKPECEQLDAYLLGWLPAEEAAAFERHLPHCDQCRRERETQEGIDRAIEGVREHPAPVPPLLVARVHRRLRAARRRRLVRIACALAACALLAVLPGRSWYAGLGGTGVSPVADSDTGRVPGRVADTGTGKMPVLPVVTVTDPSSAILVPMPSKNPEVTIVWVYPTWRP